MDNNAIYYQGIEDVVFMSHNNMVYRTAKECVVIL